MQPSPISLLGTPLRAGTPVFSAWSVTTDASSLAALLGAGFDTAVLDMQHGGFDVAQAAAGIVQCALSGKPAMVRIPVGDFATASRLLDAGAAAIIAPMINSAEEARRLVGFTKFPPLGRRSWGPGRATALSGFSGTDYLHRGNDLQLTIAMIETSQGIDQLDAILAVPGIDGIFVGPSDLSISLSGGAAVDPASPDVDRALHHAVARAKAAGKFAGMFCFTGTQARTMAARGFVLLTIATDLLLLGAAAESELAGAR